MAVRYTRRSQKRDKTVRVTAVALSSRLSRCSMCGGPEYGTFSFCRGVFDHPMLGGEPLHVGRRGCG